MNYRTELRRRLIEQIRNVVPDDVTVLGGMTLAEGDDLRFPRAILVVRESIDADRFEEINPSPGCYQQEQWTWALRVMGGGGTATTEQTETAIDDLLLDLQLGLAAFRLSRPECGPFHLLSEVNDGPHPSGVSYTQRWTHLRYGPPEVSK